MSSVVERLISLVGTSEKSTTWEQRKESEDSGVFITHHAARDSIGGTAQRVFEDRMAWWH